jgi:hypothetical protein
LILSRDQAKDRQSGRIGQCLQPADQLIFRTLR